MSECKWCGSETEGAFCSIMCEAAYGNGVVPCCSPYDAGGWHSDDCHKLDPARQDRLEAVAKAAADYVDWTPELESHQYSSVVFCRRENALRAAVAAWRDSDQVRGEEAGVAQPSEVGRGSAHAEPPEGAHHPKEHRDLSPSVPGSSPGSRFVSSSGCSTSATPDVEVESPNFVPKAAEELAARGFVRVNNPRTTSATLSPEARAALDAGLVSAKEGEAVSLGSFAQYAEERPSDAPAVRYDGNDPGLRVAEYTDVDGVFWRVVGPARTEHERAATDLQSFLRRSTDYAQFVDRLVAMHREDATSAGDSGWNAALSAMRMVIDRLAEQKRSDGR